MLTKSSQLFNKIHNVCNYNTGSHSKRNLDVKHCRTKAKSVAMGITTVKLWNDLDQHKYEINSYNIQKCYQENVQ